MKTAALLFACLALAACSSSSGGFSGTGDGGGAGGGDGASGTDSGGVDGEGMDTGAPSDSGASGGDSGASHVDGGGGTDSGTASDSGSAGGDAGTMQSVEMTFYGWADNSPPGNSIAYPVIHQGAGGTGTYADPITYASYKPELAAGTIVYAPVIEKYLIMEDLCGQCQTDWTSSMKWHIDVWMNSNGTEMSSALINCENQWTQNATTIEINPPPGRTVTTAPLFDPSTNVCRTTP